MVLCLECSLKKKKLDWNKLYGHLGEFFGKIQRSNEEKLCGVYQ